MGCSIHPSQLPNDEPGTKDTARPAAAELLRPGGEQCALKFALTPLAPPAGLGPCVTGMLLGEGRSDGLNVVSVQAMAENC